MPDCKQVLPRFHETCMYDTSPENESILLNGRVITLSLLKQLTPIPAAWALLVLHSTVHLMPFTLPQSRAVVGASGLCVCMLSGR